MLKTIGIFLLKVLGKKGWEYLKEKDLDTILDTVFYDMSKENKNYNAIFKKSPIILRELLTNEYLLESLADFLINKEDLLSDKNFAVIKSKIDNSKLKDNDIKELIEDFRKHIILNLSLNQKIRDNFLVTAVFNMNNAQKQMLEILNEEIQIVGREDTGGYTDVGAITQFKILACDFATFISEIKKMTKTKSSNRFLHVTEISDKEYSATYQNCASNKSIEITDSPFKIIYPNINKINIWFKKQSKNNLEIIEITVFCSTPSIVNKLAYLFFNCIPSYETIQQGNFHKQMKDLVRKEHSHSIYAIKFDPDITKKIKEHGFSKEITVSEETFSGDPGLPRVDEIELVLSQLNNLNLDGSSKIQFFKAKKDAKLIKGIILTFALSSNGRILAWFKKNQFNSENEKYEVLYKWYVKNADFNLISPRKRQIN